MERMETKELTVPPKRLSRNIQKSINKYLYESIASPNSLTFIFQDYTFDVSDLNKWVDVNFVSNMAGRKGATLVQLDVYVRTKGKISGGEPYADEVDRIADLIYSDLHVETISVFDFAIPTSPVVISGTKLMVQNSSGHFREPETDQVIDIEDGVIRRSIVYRLRLIGDALINSDFYD